MTIGDKGKDVGSKIKGHLGYCGNWKQDNHARYTTVCITNRDYTSQTCVYCFKKLRHSKQLIVKQEKTTKNMIEGTFICYNLICPSTRNGGDTSGRDQLSPLAIAISGITVLLFQEMLPPFTSNASHSNTDLNNRLVSFFTGSGSQDESSNPL
ncbi:hypothetical protein MFLAVUS_011038 [Mucor flavus]|uniref:Uncharacterized protein n=1 Tax=Mucor flavus TaxID=439312 RepID=A0ABP9ZEF4_9FUNG